MIYLLHEPVVIGSGGDLARLLIKMINRGMTVAGGSLHELPVEDVIGISCYIINEVKESDSHSGGETKVAVVGSNGVETLSQEKIQENFDRFLGIMAVGFAPLGLSEEDIKKIWLYGK
jgi:20S proteasome alpha/beta subunit